MAALRSRQASCGGAAGLFCFQAGVHLHPAQHVRTAAYVNVAPPPALLAWVQFQWAFNGAVVSMTLINKLPWVSTYDISEGAATVDRGSLQHTRLLSFLHAAVSNTAGCREQHGWLRYACTQMIITPASLLPECPAQTTPS